MIRSFAIAVLLSWFTISATAQTQSPPEAALQSGAPPSKTIVKKAVPKAKATAKPSAPAENGACDLGVITAAGSPTGWRKIGIMVFGNESAEAPFDAWGIDDLAFARIKAAAAGPGISVRRITYAKDAFDPYYKPEKKLSSNSNENFTMMMRGIIGNIRCTRYLVFVRFTGVLPNTNQSLTGVGVYTHGPFGKSAVFAFTRIALLDGDSLAFKDPLGFGGRLAAALSSIGRDDYIRAADTEFPASPEEAAKNPKLRDTARALVTERLDRILPEYLKP